MTVTTTARLVLPLLTLLASTPLTAATAASSAPATPTPAKAAATAPTGKSSKPAKPATPATPATPAKVPGIHAAWLREPPPVAYAAALYLHLDVGSNDDVLVAAESPVAAVTELHSMKSEGGLMEMRHVPTLLMPAGQRLEFAPGGYHLMLIQLKQPLKAGDKVPFTLVFAKAGRISGVAEVRALDAASSTDDPHAHHH
ncbi:MAG: copper chaperone PCu(A)C [Moraxellaceae bacterium]|nr:copper chaperone PCu(A)C [Moraxellaceae bacterium]